MPNTADSKLVEVDRAAVVDLVLVIEGLRDALLAVDGPTDWANLHAGYLTEYLERINGSVGADLLAGGARAYAGGEWHVAIRYAFRGGFPQDDE